MPDNIEVMNEEAANAVVEIAAESFVAGILAEQRALEEREKILVLIARIEEQSPGAARELNQHFPKVVAEAYARAWRR